MRPDAPSATARLIAGATVLSSFDPDESALLPEGAADWCARFLSTRASDRRLLASARSPIGRRFWRWVERRTIPGIVRHYHLRKRWIERAWDDARLEGFDQLIVLGAGFDTLAIRRAARGEPARFIECDHPATQRVKRAALRDEPTAQRIGWVGVDLASESLSRALDASEQSSQLSFAPSAATMIVAEGLLMYFDEPHVRPLLEEIAALPCPHLRLVMSYMEARAGRPIGFSPRSQLVEWWLSVQREPFRWATTESGAEELLRSAGFEVFEHARCESLWAGFGGLPDRPLRGENLIRADRRSPV